jgi:hypothetical protein
MNGHGGCLHLLLELRQYHLLKKFGDRREDRDGSYFTKRRIRGGFFRQGDDSRSFHILGNRTLVDPLFEGVSKFVEQRW